MIDNCLSTIYVWGSTANGALGCQYKSAKIQLVPRRMSPCCLNLLQSQTVSSVIAGNGTTTLVTDRLDAFTWGKTALKDCDVKAQRGNSCQCHRIPLANVTAVTHGSNHTIVIAGKGDVFGWGDLSAHDFRINGPKSLSAPHHSAKTKRKITKPRNIPLTCLLQRKTSICVPRRQQHFARQVACGDSHTCILVDDGTVLTMGRLRIGCNIAFANVHFEEIACGHNHCAAICRHRNACYTWGWGANGRLGHGDESPRNDPTLVEALVGMDPFITVACGYAHTLVASDGKNVYGFGWNSHSQVISYDTGLPDCLLPVVCLEVQGVLKLSCGFAHSAAVISSGELYTWGMNEDAQCGTGNELKLLTPTQIEFENKDNELYVVDVSCGHSHTVCILSKYTPLQWMRYVDRLHRLPAAASVIVSFARCALFRIRCLNHLNKRKATLGRNSIASDVLPDLMQPPEESIENNLHDGSLSSSLSSHTSFSDDDPHNLEREDEKNRVKSDDLARRLVEMTLMSDEDQRSHAYRTRLRTLRERAETLAAEKKRIHLEIEQMHKEDLLSKRARKKGKRKGNLNSIVHKANVRNSRTNEQIEKAANRLKEARERKDNQSKAKMVLPFITRKVSTRNQGSRPALHAMTANNEHMYAADAGHVKRRQKLLKRRENRLEAQEQLKKEADLARAQKLKDEKESQMIEAQLKQNEMAQEQRRIAEARKLRRLQRNAEVQKLEKELRTNDSLRLLSIENKENESEQRFRDVSHWIKSLYGQS